MAGRRSRIPIVLACANCGSRNYKTTKAATSNGPLILSKFCKVCKSHTEHRETK